MLSGVIFWVAILSLTVGAFWGLVRGFGRSFLRLFLTVVAFAVSMVLCTSFISDPERLMQISFFEKLIGKVPLLRDLTAVMPELAPLALSLPTAMFSPLAFIVIFLALSAVLLVLYWLAGTFLFPKGERHRIFSPISHVLGMLLGVLQGATVLLALMVPVVGMADLTVEIVDTVKAEDGIYSVEVVENLAKYRDDLLELKDSRVYGYAERFGAEAICDALMQYEIEDADGERTTVDLRHETLILAKMYAHSFPLQSTPPRSFGARQAEALQLLADDLADSELLTRLAAGFLSSASTEWKEGSPFLGIKPFTMQGELAELPSVLYDAFDESTPETVREDLSTLSELVSLLSRYGVFAVISDGEALADAISDPDALAEITACLRKNPRTAPVADALLEIALKAFCDAFLPSVPEGDPTYGAYRDLLDTVAEAINGLSPDAPLAEQIDALSPELATAFSEYGVESDAFGELILDSAAELLLGELSGSIGSATADDVAALLSGQSIPAVGE